MYHSLIINGINTWDDWHLVPESRPLVVPPTPKTSYLEVPCSDFQLDLTEYLTGYPTYGSREGSWKFIVMNGYGEWYERYSSIMGTVHNRTAKVILEDDPGYFYTGRLHVESWESNNDGTWSNVTIGYNLDPYKYSINTTLEDWLWDPFNFETDTIQYYKDLTVNGSMTVDIIGGAKRTVPIITCSSDMQVTVNNVTYQLKSGTTDGNTLYELQLVSGTNTLKFTGYGTVSIEFRGSAL